MGMGYGANHHHTITEADLRTIVPDTDILMASLENSEFIDHGSFVRILNEIDDTSDEDEDREYQRFLKIWDNIKKEFESKTGMTLYLGYHDSEENGSSYDDVEGLFFGVDGVYTLSEEAKKVREEYGVTFESSFFVTFG